MAVKVFICLVLITTTLAEGFLDYLKRDKLSTKNVRNGSAVNKKINNRYAMDITEIPPGTEISEDVSEEMDNPSSQLYLSDQPQYEVYENIVDVPDDRTLIGPIVVYTTPSTLNTVRPNNTATVNPVTDSIQTKKKKVTVLHLNAEFDGIDNKGTGIFNGIKSYLCGLHQGIVEGIHSFFHNDVAMNAERYKRSAVDQTNEGHIGKLNSDNVDKTDFFVRKHHISLT